MIDSFRIEETTSEYEIFWHLSKILSKNELLWQLPGTVYLLQFDFYWLREKGVVWEWGSSVLQ